MLLKSAYLATLREKIQALKKEYSSLQWMGNRVESVQRRRAMLHEQLSVLVRLHRHLHAIHQNVQTGNKKQAFIWVRAYTHELERFRQSTILGIHYPVTMGDPITRWPDIARMEFPQFACNHAEHQEIEPLIPFEVYNGALAQSSTQKQVQAKLKKQLLESLTPSQLVLLRAIMDNQGIQSVTIHSRELPIEKD